jgi:F0F1-type ATP synthase assembly protein I
MTTPERKPPTRGAVAGMMVLAALLMCAGIGALVGALVGGLPFFLIGGVFAGFVLGIVAVRARFPDL